MEKENKMRRKRKKYTAKQLDAMQKNVDAILKQMKQIKIQ